MKYIHAILIYDGIYDCKGIQAWKVEFDRLESANFVQVLCKHFSKIYINFSKVISPFQRKCPFSLDFSLFYTILWLFVLFLLRWGGRGRTFKSCHSDQKTEIVRSPFFFVFRRFSLVFSHFWSRSALNFGADLFCIFLHQIPKTPVGAYFGTYVADFTELPW